MYGYGSPLYPINDHGANDKARMRRVMKEVRKRNRIKAASGTWLEVLSYILVICLGLSTLIIN